MASMASLEFAACVTAMLDWSINVVLWFSRAGTKICGAVQCHSFMHAEIWLLKT